MVFTNDMACKYLEGHKKHTLRTFQHIKLRFAWFFAMFFCTLLDHALKTCIWMTGEE